MQPPLDVLLGAAMMHFIAYHRDPVHTYQRLVTLHGKYGADEVVECIELLQDLGLQYTGIETSVYEDEPAPGAILHLTRKER
jgi:hypothetical protein